ncbi:MAG: MFS transporter [Thermoplasmata archaeon]
MAIDSAHPPVQSLVPGSQTRRVQVYAYAATAFWGFSLGLLTVTLPFRFLQLGIPIFEYGVTLSVYAAGMLLTESLWGVLAFRLARPATIIGLGSVVGFATLLLGFAQTFPAFLLAEVLLGAVGVYLAPLLRWVALSSGGPGAEGRGAGRWSSVFGLGIAVGVTLGPLVFVIYGFRDVAITSIGVLAIAVAAAAALPWSLAALPTAVRSQRRALRALATRPFLIALVLVLIAYIATTFASNFFQYYSTVLFGGTVTEAGYVLGGARLLSLVPAFALGTVVDRGGPARSIPPGFALLLIGALATWASHSYDEMAVATLVFAAGTGWLAASVLPFAVEAMPRVHQGTAIGVFGSTEDAGLLIGPLLFGAAWTTYGPTSIFPVATAVAAVGLVASLMVFGQNRRPRRIAASPEAAAGDPD